VAAALLREHGITVFSDRQLPQLLAWMEQRESAMIQCKRVYDPQEASDGYRPGRPPLAARNKKEALRYDEWCKILAPSTELRKAFHGETLDFAHFSQRYRQELDARRDEGLRSPGWLANSR
jgi:uncharacterized protein YeaO (DUF488 family)